MVKLAVSAVSLMAMLSPLASAATCDTTATPIVRSDVLALIYSLNTRPDQSCVATANADNLLLNRLSAAAFGFGVGTETRSSCQDAAASLYDVINTCKTGETEQYVFPGEHPARGNDDFIVKLRHS